MRFRNFAVALGAALLLQGGASAQISDDVVKLGVLNDQSAIYSDLSGQGSVVAARMVVEDHGGTAAGKKIEVIFADHQNKPNIGSAIASRWYDTERVDAIVDVPVSSVALAVQEVARQRNRIVLFSAAGTSDLTGKACAPGGFHWTFDTVALAKGTASAVTKAGGDTWFFLTADYAFGHTMETDARRYIQEAGGKVLGGQKLAGLLLFLTDIHSLGLKTAQGIQLTESFYWDLNDKTRAWSKRFAEWHGGKMPTMVHAGVYSAVSHYLKAVNAAGTDRTAEVAAKMKERPVDDFMTDNAAIRKDGRVMRKFYLFEVKAPSKSKALWDYYKLIREIPAEEASRPTGEGGCPLVN